MGIGEANALSKDIIDLINRTQPGLGREVLVALADATAFVIKQWYKPEHRDEAVEWHASLVKMRIEILSSRSEEND